MIVDKDFILSAEGTPTEIRECGGVHWTYKTTE